MGERSKCNTRLHSISATSNSSYKERQVKNCVSLEVVCCCGKMRKTSFGFTVAAHHDREITSVGALRGWFHRIHGQKGEGHFLLLSQLPAQTMCHPQRMCLPTSINPQIIDNRQACPQACLPGKSRPWQWIKYHKLCFIFLCALQPCALHTLPVFPFSCNSQNKGSNVPEMRLFFSETKMCCRSKGKKHFVDLCFGSTGLLSQLLWWLIYSRSSWGT